MAISQEQADTWSGQPDSGKAKATHEAIRKALRDERSLVRTRDFEDFLQGSYRNDTNIRTDSDVDIVVRLNSAFWYDTSRLGPFWEAEVTRTFSDASYGFDEFRRDVFATLVQAFGQANVVQQNKCITVKASGGRLDADVVPCLYHRAYAPSTAYDTGIAFETVRERRRSVNYPIQHYENGVAKHRATDGVFKPVVRLAKNARNEAIHRRTLAEGKLAHGSAHSEGRISTRMVD